MDPVSATTKWERNRSGIRHDNDVAKTRAMVSEVCRHLANSHGVVSDIHHNMLKSQEGIDGQRQPVSDTHTLSVVEYQLTIAQTQTRSTVSNTMGSTVLRSCSIPPGELPPPSPKAYSG